MKNNKNCISKCYPANTKILHPLYLIPVSNNKPFCLINNKKYHESCTIDDNDDDTNVNDYFIPRIGMDEKSILNYVYDINDWDELLKFIKKDKHLIELTIDRLLTNSWISFYDFYNSNTDIIIEIYNIFIHRFYKTSDIEISNIIYSIKKNKIIDIHQYIKVLIDKSFNS